MTAEREPSTKGSVEEKDGSHEAGVVPMYYSVDEAGQPGLNDTAARKISTLGATAGTVKNIDADGDIILLPTPTNDANDPLNWSRAYKWYMTCVVCLGAFMSNLTTAGPSIAIIQTSMSYRVEPTTTAYLYSCAALMLGFSMFWWSPLASKFGKRPSMC